MKREHRILDGMPIGDIEQAAGEGGNTSWQPIAVMGEWKGHWMGPFSISASQLKQMADSITGAGIDIVVDYEHASVFSDKAPAAGWIKTAEVQEDHAGNGRLVAQIAWTNTAAQHIREQEYKYLSPVIVWNTRDRQTGRDAGTSIQSVALTNVPFLHELPEVRLNSLRAAFAATEPEPEDPMDKEQFEALCKVLGMDPKTSTPEQVLQRLGEDRTQLQAITEALGAQDGTSPIDAANALRAQATAADPNEVAALRTTVQQMQATQAQGTALQAVREAQREGKVAGDDTDNFKHCLEWATRDLEGFKKYIQTIPVFAVAPGHQEPSASTGATALPSGDVDAQTLAYAHALGLTPKDVKDAREADTEALGNASGAALCRLWGASLQQPMTGKE